jgi:hypothetical protein
MAASNAIHGKDASASIGGEWLGGVTYAATITRDTADVSCFGDTWGIFVAGLPRVQGTFSGLHTLGGDSAASSGMSGLVSIAFYAGATCVASGMAYVSSGVEAAVNDAVRVSGSFVSTGPWSIA